MKPIERTPLRHAQLAVLHGLERTTTDMGVRPRPQMILLAAEHGMSAPAIAQIVCDHAQPVRNRFKRDAVEGAAGRHEAPRPGAPRHVTPEYRTPLVAVVRVWPRRLGWPSALWPLARCRPRGLGAVEPGASAYPLDHWGYSKKFICS